MLSLYLRFYYYAAFFLHVIRIRFALDVHVNAALYFETVPTVLYDFSFYFYVWKSFSILRMTCDTSSEIFKT